MNSSTPEIQDFDPTIIPFQNAVLKHLRRDFDYSTGVCELLLSGSIGSAKTILAAHIVATHALFYPGSQQLAVRRALKDLKNTFWRVLLAHYPELNNFFNKSEMKINLPNGSIIYGSSYDDGNYSRFRSYDLSGVVIEEATENTDSDLYDELLMRVARLPHVKENYLLQLTNPDSPGHFIHDKFMDNPTPNRKVFYSLTEQNPFLPKTYIQQLKASLDSKMAERMLYGKWIEIKADVIYYAYDRQNNYRDYDYKIREDAEINLGWDFNVGEGKPMSVSICQNCDDEFHFFSEVVIHSARTLTVLEELQARGMFDKGYAFVINGDATGAARSSNSLHSNYDIIKQYLSNYRDPQGRGIKFRMNVPRSNPPVRERHNKVNAYCRNALNKSRLFVYRTAPMTDKGLRLTALKKGGNYVEDDSKEYQHVTCGIGYTLCSEVREKVIATTSAR